MPLPALRSFSLPNASLEPLDHPAGAGAARGASLGHPGARGSTPNLASRASHSSHLAEAWQPYLKCAGVQPPGLP